MDKETAYKLGRDVALNGANITNSNFRVFSQPEFTDAWTKGRDDALSEKSVAEEKEE